MILATFAKIMFGVALFFVGVAITLVLIAAWMSDIADKITKGIF